PHGKSLGKVLGGMCLRVPGIEMQYVVPAARIRFVKVGIRFCERTKGVAPISPAVEGVSVAQSVAGLVTHYPHAFDVADALDFEHKFALEPHQALVGQVKRNSKSWNAIGREPVC